jgi:hypothetical protein
VCWQVRAVVGTTAVWLSIGGGDRRWLAPGAPAVAIALINPRVVKRSPAEIAVTPAHGTRLHGSCADHPVR